MSAPLVALGVVAVIVFGAIAFALIGVHRIRMTPTEYMVGGRSFGSLFLWLLMAGEIYTSFTFLGAAGWAYGKGAPAFYILAYGTIGYIVGYFLLPPVWRLAKEHGFLTAADFFAHRYGTRWLAPAIAVVYFFLIVPYVTLQLSGLETLLSLAGYGAYNATLTVGAAFAVIALFVFTAGLRGTAWASIIKDSLVLCAVVFAGVYLPIHFFGSPAAVFDRIVETNPHWLTLQSTGPYPPSWYVSTVLITGVGFFAGSHNWAAVFSARGEDTLRRNAMLLPLYQLLLVLVMFAGFTALLLVPGLKGAAADQSFMLVVQKYFPPWVLGLIAGAGCLAALVPASAQLLGAASILSKNLIGDVFNLATGDRARTMTTRVLVLIVAGMALLFWLNERTTLVELLLLYYNGIIQMLPGFIFGLTWPRVHALAVGLGIGAGLITAVLLSKTPTVFGLNNGCYALAANLAVCIMVTLLLPAPESTREALPEMHP